MADTKQFDPKTATPPDPKVPIRVDEKTVVKTDYPITEESAPRMPHERDESYDSQTTEGGPPRESMKQAHKDLMNGQVDTDLRNERGVDAVVNNPPGPSPANPRDVEKPPGKK